MKKISVKMFYFCQPIRLHKSFIFGHFHIENLAVSALGQNGRLLLLIGLLVFKNLLKIRVDLCFDCSFCAFNQEGKIAPRKYEESDYH